MQNDHTLADETERSRRAALRQYLAHSFGPIPEGTWQAICACVEWQVLHTGDVLMTQGDPGDTAFLSLSGRLRVYVTGDDGVSRMVRELGRGEIIGELSLFTGAPRSATVVAVRKSLVARLDKAHFHALVARNPQVSIALTQKIIERLQTQHQRQPVPAPVMLSLLPITAGVDARAFAASLAQALQRHGRVHVAQAPADPAWRTERLSDALDGLEAQHDFVLLVVDTQPNEWTRTCLAHSDEVLLLADATQPVAMHPVETACLADDDGTRSEVAETLVLLHPADTVSPLGMRAWVDRRPVTGHVNLRPTLIRDMERLARLLSRTAVGLVLAGGGARGFAHLGIWRVLRARGIEIDCVGGTSMGAVMAAVIAADREMHTTLDVTREAFRVNPTGDYNLLPLVSLIKGQRVRAAVRNAIQRLMGGPVDIVDLWKGYFCIASNYTKGQEMRLHQGDLGRSVLASIAIPGALPPVVMAGDLVCDGGTFNNFPANVMREMRGVGRVVGVDLGARSGRPLDFDEMPSAWQLLWDRFKPRSQRRYRVPSLVSYLLNVTILYSVSRQSESRRQTDLYFNPPLLRVGLLQWNRFRDIVEQGEAHAHEVLNALSPAEKARWGLPADSAVS